MGRQINFYLHPSDYKELEDILKSSDEVAFLPYYHHDNSVRTVEDTISPDIKKDGARVYVVRKAELNSIRLKQIEKFGYWLLDDTPLPVLHYDRCQLEDGKIIRGRLYFQPQYVKDMQWVNKSEEFVSWANSIIGKVRRKFKKYKFDRGDWGFSEYVGKNTKEWLDKTKLETGKTDADLIST